MVAAATGNIVEVQVEAPRGRQLFFRPIGKPLRGTVDYSQAKTASDFKKQQRWPEIVPGIVLGINLATGEKYLREPLHEPRHANVRRRIEGYGYQIPPEREDHLSESVATWVYWLTRAAEAGLVRVIAGELPSLSSLEGEPRKHFITTPRQSHNGQLTAAIERLAEATEKQSKLLDRLLSASTK